jgi:14-3-3 protein epsilon
MASTQTAEKTITSDFQIEEYIFMARVAEQTERFQDMVDFLKPVMQSKGVDISVDERNLVSIAFKNMVAQRRVAWRTLLAY